MPDYAAASRGLLGGLQVGQQMMRQYQQDQRQAAIDTQADQRYQDERRIEQERYNDAQTQRNKLLQQQEQDRLMRNEAEATNRRAAAASLYLTDPKVDAQTLSALWRQDKEHAAFVDNDGTGKAFHRFVKTGEGPEGDRYLVELKMPDGSIKPLSMNRGTDDEIVTFDTPTLTRLTQANYVKAGADPRLFATPKQAIKPEIIEVGAGGGRLVKAALYPDGRMVPLGEGYAQFNPESGRSGGVDGGSAADDKERLAIIKNLLDEQSDYRKRAAAIRSGSVRVMTDSDGRVVKYADEGDASKLEGLANEIQQQLARMGLGYAEAPPTKTALPKAIPGVKGEMAIGHGNALADAPPAPQVPFRILSVTN